MNNISSFLSVAALLMGSTALAQDLPQEDALTGLVAETTPSYWSVSELEVVATSRGGDAARPQAQIRFEANAAPDAALFAESTREGPFVVVVRTETEGSVRRLYGYFDLAYGAGKWDGDVVIENPVDAFGQPRDLFDAPTLVLGTDEAETRLAALRDNDVSRAIARHETAMSDLANKHQRALSALKAEQTRAVTQARARQTEELSEITTVAKNAINKQRADGERRLAAAQQAYETRLARLKAEQEPLIAAAEAERAETVAEEQAKAEAALSAVREEAANELEKLSGDHAARRGKLIETQRQELAELETRLATERQSLQRQLETAQDTIALQQELLVAMESRAAGAEQVLTAFNEARETRRNFFARIPRDWTGQAVCATADESYNATFPLSLLMEEVTTTGFTGYVRPEKDMHSRSAMDASLTNADSSMTLPMTMRLQTERTGGTSGNIINFLNDFDISVTPDGRMLASFERTVTVDSVNKSATCNVRLGVRDS